MQPVRACAVPNTDRYCFVPITCGLVRRHACVLRCVNLGLSQAIWPLLRSLGRRNESATYVMTGAGGHVNEAVYSIAMRIRPCARVPPSWRAPRRQRVLQPAGWSSHRQATTTTCWLFLALSLACVPAGPAGRATWRPGAAAFTAKNL